MVTVEDVRLLTSITSDELSDTVIADIIDKAWIQLMNDITAKITRILNPIDNTRLKYKIVNAEGWIFDVDNDGTIDYDDVTIFYFDDKGEAHEISTSFTYNPLDNILTFSSSLANETYYIEYREVYTDNSSLIEQAHLWLSAYLLVIRVWGMAPQVVRMGRSGWDMKKPGFLYLNTYYSIVSSINPTGRSIEYESHPSLLDNSI